MIHDAIKCWDDSHPARNFPTQMESGVKRAVLYSNQIADFSFIWTIVQDMYVDVFKFPALTGSMRPRTNFEHGWVSAGGVSVQGDCGIWRSPGEVVNLAFFMPLTKLEEIPPGLTVALLSDVTFCFRDHLHLWLASLAVVPLLHGTRLDTPIWIHWDVLV